MISHIDTLYQQLKKGQLGKMSESVRDLTKIKLSKEYSLIIAVDSAGGIGPMEGDTVVCDPYDLGRFVMRVPLLELLACGASPLAAFDMLTLPMKGVGEQIVKGVKDELKQAGLDDDFPLSGSTEDNVPTVMTGIGTTVIGLVHENDFRPGTSQIGDMILCVGIPKSAPEDNVTLDDSEMVNQNDILIILGIEGVHEILPVGSKGIAYEAGEMACLASLTFTAYEEIQIDLKKSGGPSTCVILSCQPGTETKINEIINVPIHGIGTFS